MNRVDYFTYIGGKGFGADVHDITFSEAFFPNVVKTSMNFC
jgi:hypothetical protein